MEDIIAVRVRLKNGEKKYFLTWGRIQDAIDTREVEKIILHRAQKFALKSNAISAEVCESFQEASNQKKFSNIFSQCYKKRYLLVLIIKNGEKKLIKRCAKERRFGF